MQKLIVILGPTAVGKTKFAVQLAYKFNGEIISADSRQVYKLMDIGTGKDINEYSFNNKKIPYHIIDVANPTNEYDLFSFQKDFYNAIKIIAKNKNTPFLVGGTGLYIHSILKNYKLKEVDFNSARAKFLTNVDESELKIILNKLRPIQHNITDIEDKQRIIKAILITESNNEVNSPYLNFSTLVIGIRENREIVKKRITDRLKYRLQNGMIEEVKKLISFGIAYEKLDFFGLEYKFIGKFLQGELTYNDMFQKLNSAIHQFSKRQMTWFRKMEKEGVLINWMSYSEIDKAYFLISDFLKK